MSVIVDADDSKYWEQRAIEQIKELHLYGGSDAEDRISLAIRLLTLSLVKRKKDALNPKEKSP